MQESLSKKDRIYYQALDKYGVVADKWEEPNLTNTGMVWHYRLDFDDGTTLHDTYTGITRVNNSFASLLDYCLSKHGDQRLRVTEADRLQIMSPFKRNGLEQPSLEAIFRSSLAFREPTFEDYVCGHVTTIITEKRARGIPPESMVKAIIEEMQDHRGRFGLLSWKRAR